MKELIKNKKLIWAVAIVAAFILAAFIGHLIYDAATSITCKISKTENGSVQLEASVADLKAKNIEVGDSLLFKFSTAYVAEDVAFLNGAFMNSGMHIAIAQSQDSPVVFQYQNLGGLWDKASLNENSTVKINVSTKSKYLKLNEALTKPITQSYTNVRSLRGGNLKLLNLFRGSSPNTNADVNGTLYYYYKNLSINNKINLDENKYGITTIDIKNIDCNKMIIDTLFQLVNNQNRTYIYSSNNDTTAYFCAIIEAIAGASYEEILNDYMETYKNLYGITKEEKPEEYNAIKTYHIDWFLHKFTKTLNDYDLSKCDFAYDAEMYLRSNGVSGKDIDLIKNRLTA